MLDEDDEAAAPEDEDELDDESEGPDPFELDSEEEFEELLLLVSALDDPPRLSVR